MSEFFVNFVLLYSSNKMRIAKNSIVTYIRICVYISESPQLGFNFYNVHVNVLAVQMFIGHILLFPQFFFRVGLNSNNQELNGDAKLVGFFDKLEYTVL